MEEQAKIPLIHVLKVINHQGDIFLKNSAKMRDQGTKVH